MSGDLPLAEATPNIFAELQNITINHAINHEFFMITTNFL